MAVFTYWGNLDPNDGTAAIQVASGTIGIGEWGDISQSEYTLLSQRYDLRAGELRWEPIAPFKYPTAYGHRTSGATTSSSSSGGGNVVRAGSGTPSDLIGGNGDLFLDEAEKAFVGPKASGTWIGARRISFVSSSETGFITVGSSVYTGVRFVTDGVDDHVQIEEAIASLPEVGGVVRVLGRVYLGRAIALRKSNVTLEGAGFSTELFLQATASDNVITVTAEDVTIRSLRVNGNRSNIEADHHGISISAARCRIREVIVTDTVHHGIQSPNSTDLVCENVYIQNTGKVGSNRDGAGMVIGAGAGPCIGAKLTNVWVFNTGYHGIQVYKRSQHVQMANVSAAKVGQTRESGSGLEIHPGTYDIKVHGLTLLGAEGGATGGGLVVDSEAGFTPAMAVVLSGVMIEGHPLSGVTINGGSDVTIVGGDIKNNGRLGSVSNRYGIRIKNGAAGDVAQRVHIFGVRFSDDQETRTQAYPIGVYEESTDINVFGNTFFRHATADTVYIDASSRGTVNRFMNSGETTLTVGGDLSGSLLAPLVARVQGKRVVAPNAGNDQYVAIYENATNEIKWSSIASEVSLATLKARTHRRVFVDLVSMYSDWMNLASNTTVTEANNLFGYVMRVPRTGRLRDITLSVNSQSGNVAVSVYDVAAEGGTRNRLYSSGSVACPAQGWRIIADPNLEVVENQLICLAFSCDNATATFGRYGSLLGSASAAMPAAFAPEGEIRVACSKRASFPDASERWTTPALTTVPFGIVARVS